MNQATANQATANQPSTTSPLLLGIFWLYVGIPLAIGIWETLLKAAALFN